MRKSPMWVRFKDTLLQRGSQLTIQIPEMLWLCSEGYNLLLILERVLVHLFVNMRVTLKRFVFFVACDGASQEHVAGLADKQGCERVTAAMVRAGAHLKCFVGSLECQVGHVPRQVVEQRVVGFLLAIILAQKSFLHFDVAPGQDVPNLFGADGNEPCIFG